MKITTDQTKLIRFLESELNGFKLKFLFKDKQLLNEGKFDEFAQVLLKRSKKSYGIMFVAALFFLLIGALYISNMLIPGSPLWIGASYLFLGVSFMVISTKEYYKIRGSMTLLLKLLEADEETESEMNLDLETA